MTLFEVEELCRYWAEHPPPHIAAAACLGFGNPARERPHRSEAAASVAALAAGLGPGFGAADVHRGLGRAVLDFAALKSRSGPG